MPKIDQLSAVEIKHLAQCTLTVREKNRQASKEARLKKKKDGLVQVSVWTPKGSPGITKIREFAKSSCEKKAPNANEADPKNR